MRALRNEWHFELFHIDKNVFLIAGCLNAKRQEESKHCPVKKISSSLLSFDQNLNKFTKCSKLYFRGDVKLL